MKKQPINTNKDSSSSDKNDHELEQLLNDLIAHLKKVAPSAALATRWRNFAGKSSDEDQ